MRGEEEASRNRIPAGSEGREQRGELLPAMTPSDAHITVRRLRLACR